MGSVSNPVLSSSFGASDQSTGGGIFGSAGGNPRAGGDGFGGHSSSSHGMTSNPRSGFSSSSCHHGYQNPRAGGFSSFGSQGQADGRNPSHKKSGHYGKHNSRRGNGSKLSD